LVAENFGAKTNQEFSFRFTFPPRQQQQQQVLDEFGSSWDRERAEIELQFEGSGLNSSHRLDAVMAIAFRNLDRYFYFIFSF
jgi:hypothetical protein